MSWHPHEAQGRPWGVKGGKAALIHTPLGNE